MSLFRDKRAKENGLHSLKDPVADDIIVLNHLIKWIEDESSKRKEKSDFIQKTDAVLKSLQAFYNKSSTNSVSVSLPQLREFISLIAEILYLTTSCYIFKLASESTVKIPSKSVNQIKDLDLRLNNIHQLVLELHPLKLSDSLCAGERNAQFWVSEEAIAMTLRSRQIQNQLEGCEVILCMVVEAVEGKCRKECTIFNTMSISIGAVCAGRMAWSLWQGDGMEELMKAGLWSAGTGLSAIVLQIYRVRMSDILAQLEKQRQNRKKIKAITESWRVSRDWSYAKLVRLPSPRTAA